MILKPIVSLFFMKTIAFSFITPPSLNKLYVRITGSSNEVHKYNTDSNVYSIPRKTILDLGDSFVNSTHDVNLDVTVVTRDYMGYVKNKGPVIFLPGLDMSGLSIYPNAIRASDERDVIVFLAGYSRNQTLDQLSEKVVDYISSKDLKDIILVGESFGGVLAIDCASQIRKRITKMILINPATSFPRTKWMKKITSISSVKNYDMTSKILGHGPRAENVLKSIIEISEAYPEHTYNYIMTYMMMAFNVIVTNPLLVTKRITLYLDISIVKMDSMCRVIQIPTTIVVGRNDRLLPSSKEAHRLSRLIDGSDIVKLDNTGHMVTSDVFDIREFM